MSENFVVEELQEAKGRIGITGDYDPTDKYRLQDLDKAIELARLQAQAVDLLREVKKRYVVPPDSIPKRIRDLLKSIDEVSKR